MDSQTVADRYYDAFRKKTDFSEVPLSDDLRFRAPGRELDGGAPFRQVVAGLAQSVQGLKVRHQLVQNGTVVSVYDFDLGLPGGPVPMAEVLQVRGGEIAEIELIFDSPRLAPPTPE